MTTLELMRGAKAAAPALAAADGAVKNAALFAMAEALCRRAGEILAANKEDMEAAKGHISEVMLDRLLLTQPRVAAMADGIRSVASLPDPVGEVLSREERPNGLLIEKTAVPLGVIAIIYESRPNVTSDAAALCVKSGNACILRCGKEAWRSAAAVTAALQEGLRSAGLPAALVQLVEMFLKKTIPSLYRALGVYLPLITTNCAVLGVALINVQKDYTILQGTIYGLATAIGFTIAMVLMAGLREKMEYNDIPESFKGMPIVLLTAMLMSMAFMGFSGMI